MILDRRTEMADNLVVGPGIGTFVLGDQIPTGPGPLTGDVGAGEHVHLVGRVSQAFTSAGAATVEFQFVTDDNAALSSPTVIFTTGPIAVAQLPLGAFVFNMVLPRAIYEAFIGVRAIVATAALTAGRVDVFLTPNGSGWRALADAVN